MRLGLVLLFPYSKEEPLDTAIFEQVKELIREGKLDPALAEFFISRNETALQLRYAKVIADKLLEDWLPAIKAIVKKIVELQEIKYSDVKISEDGFSVQTTDRDLPEPQLTYVNESLNELQKLQSDLIRYNRSIIRHIEDFAPDLYNQYVDRFNQYVPVRKIGKVSDNQEPNSKDKVEDHGQSISIQGSDPMKTNNTDRLDFILRQLELFKASLDFIEDYNDDGDLVLATVLQSRTNYFTSIEDSEQYFMELDLLSKEIRDRFLNYREIKLQDRYALYLLNLIVNEFVDLHASLLDNHRKFIDGSFSELQGTEEFRIIEKNIKFGREIDFHFVSRWIEVILENVKMFSPELYRANEDTIGRMTHVSKSGI